MFRTAEILKATNGNLLQGKKNLFFSSVSTDTRKIKRGELFIPIVGKKFDGHGFVAEALKKGAAGTLVSKSVEGLPKNKVVIEVRDTQRALQDIARSHRLKFRIPFIGVTGSSGKTTTKDMIASILSQEKKTLKNEGNINNEIGVPLTLLNLNKTHGAAVIEMAMQRKGEIDELASIVLPNVALITNIGEAHMEFFRSKKKIAEVKAEMLNYLKNKDTAVLNADDDHFAFLKKRARGARVISFGIDRGANVSAENISKKNKGISFTLKYGSKKISIDLPLPGRHNIYNALSSAAACLSIGIRPNSIRQGLKKFKPSSKRMNIIEKDGVRVIDDSYNANPSSMKAALSVLSEEGPVIGKNHLRRIAVLGDMLELGRISKRSHVEIGKYAAKRGVDILITKGHLSRDTARGAMSSGLKSVYATRSNEEASKILRKIVKQNDVILIKGSRGMKMEEIAENILK